MSRPLEAPPAVPATALSQLHAASLSGGRMPAPAAPRLALTLVALPTLALSLSLRPGPSVPHLPTLRHRHTPLSMIAPAPRRNPNQGTIDRLLNPLRRRVYTLLKPVSARAARTARPCPPAGPLPRRSPARRPLVASHAWLGCGGVRVHPRAWGARGWRWRREGTGTSRGPVSLEARDGFGPPMTPTPNPSPNPRPHPHPDSSTAR